MDGRPATSCVFVDVTLSACEFSEGESESSPRSDVVSMVAKILATLSFHPHVI